MRGHELRELRAERLPCRGDDVALRAAGVGDDGLRLEDRRDRLQDRAELRHRRRDQHEVRTARRRGRVGRRGVDRAALERELEVRRTAPGADHLAAGAGLLQRERERAADQADADHRDFAEKHQSLRLDARAERNF